MRRRLWWSLTLFDTRIGEMADSKAGMLIPTWDCRIPLNVNDSDIRPEMKEPPLVHAISSEALFVVVRSELGDFVRRSMFHLDFTNPALKPIAKDTQHNPGSEGSELTELEKSIEDKYLKNCDPANPLHFMTIWATRAYLAKCHLLEHYSSCPSSSVHQMESQRDAAISYALSMLECDTKIMTSSVTKGFRWLIHIYFPFTAYIHLVQNLKRRPSGNQAERAWEMMDANFEARFGALKTGSGPFLDIFTTIVLQAWDAREATFKQLGVPLVTPSIVLCLRRRRGPTSQNEENSKIAQPHSAVDMDTSDLTLSVPIDFDSRDSIYSMGGQDSYALTSQELYPHLSGLFSLDADINQLDWSAMDWDSGMASAGKVGDFTEPPVGF